MRLVHLAVRPSARFHARRALDRPVLDESPTMCQVASVANW
jgi:hypothetical protein